MVIGKDLQKVITMSSSILPVRIAINQQKTQWKVNRVYFSLLSTHYTDTLLNFSSPISEKQAGEDGCEMRGRYKN
jgi:hypothetical protein